MRGRASLATAATLAAVLPLLCATAGSGAAQPAALPTVAGPDGPPEGAKGPYKVIYVSDGDTFGITRTVKGKSRDEVIRVLALDTPETKDPYAPKECYGEEASKEAVKLLKGKKVWLESDPAEPSKDKYDRRLAHVWLPNGQLYAWKMVRDGYGRYSWVRGRWLLYDKQTKAAEDKAEAEHLGLWKKCGGDGHKPL